MAKITKVPNGPLIKKKGPFKGSTLKNGGTTTTKTTIKPDYSNMKTTKRSFFKNKEYTPTAIDSSYYRQGFDRAVGGKSSLSGYDMKTIQGLRGYEEATKKGLNPSRKPKAKAGAMIKRAQYGKNVEVEKKEPTITVSKDTIGNQLSKMDKAVKEIKRPVISKKKNGGMIKRADGSMSKRGLWDNIRANKGSGKKPTKQMLVQEKKIKAKSKK